MEQLIESQYAKKIKENINLKSNNEKLEQELKSQKDILNQVKILLQQSLSVLIRQSKAKNENISNASYDKLIGNINLIVNEISPDFEAVLYGSYATGLCLPWSDLDIVLVNKGQTPMAVPYIINKLYYLIIILNYIIVIKRLNNSISTRQ